MGELQSVAESSSESFVCETFLQRRRHVCCNRKTANSRGQIGVSVSICTSSPCNFRNRYNRSINMLQNQASTTSHSTTSSSYSCKAVRGHPDAVSIFLREPKACEYKLTVESTLVCNLLTNVDEDGLPELLSPANHRPKTTEQENQEDRRKDAVEA